MNAEKISLQNNNEVVIFEVLLDWIKLKLNEITVVSSQQEESTDANRCADKGMRDLLRFVVNIDSKNELLDAIGKYVS